MRCKHAISAPTWNRTHVWAALLLAFGVTLPCDAQKHVVEDSRGQDIFVEYFHVTQRPGFNLSFNTSAEALKGRLFVPSGSSASTAFHLLTASYQASDGIVDIIQGSRVSSVRSLGYRYGFEHVLLKDDDATSDIDWLIVGFDYSTASYRLFDRDAGALGELRTEEVSGVELTGMYARMLGGKRRVSLNVGYRRENNYDDLDEVTIEDGESVVDPEGGTRTIVTRTTSARTGEFKEFDVFRVGVSLITLPSEARADTAKLKLGFGSYAFARLSSESSPVDAGVSLNLTRANRATGIRNTIGGLFVEVRDVFDAAGTENGLSDRIRVGVFTNIPLIDF